MFKNQFGDKNVSKLQSFEKEWGPGWVCCDFVERSSKEDLERCQQAVKEINESVVVPGYDSQWDLYKPHDTLFQKLDECKKKYKHFEGVVPRSVVEGSNNGESIRVNDLLKLATRHGESFHTLLKDIVWITNGEYKQGPRKRLGRILDKAKEDYDGDVSRVIDIERATGIYDSSEDLAKAVKDLSDLSKKDPRFEIVRVKDSFSETNWPSHYRDMKFSIKIKGLVGELKLCLRRMDHWNKIVHKVYSVERVVMNKGSAPDESHGGLVSVPVLRFTTNDGRSIEDGDRIDDLQRKLKAILPEGCTFSGGYLSKDAVQVYLGVANVASFARLRDIIMLPENKFSIALSPFTVDIGAFIDLYATNLMKFSGLTDHQEEQLEKIRGADIALLLAPAGGGKTFVAIQCMLEAIQEGNHILFVARNSPLALFVVRWLVLASGKLAENIVDKVRVLIDDNADCKFSDGPLRVVVVTKGGRQFLDVKKSANDVSTYRIAVVDEAHHVVNDLSLKEQLHKLNIERYLFLGDASQSYNVAKGLTKEALRDILELQDSQPIMMTKLTEVVRCTKRIVAGASSFQLASASKVETKTHITSEGLPLVPHLFAPVPDNERAKTYSRYVVRALKNMQKSLHGVNLDDRVMIICPDDKFAEELRLPLLEELHSQMNEKYDLVSAYEASSALPVDPSTDAADLSRWLVFDAIDRVDGLERLVVIATGLDESIKETEGDIHTRSALYRALTRAQLGAAVVNEHVQDGFLEFLRRVEYHHGDFNEKNVELQLSSNEIDNIQEKAKKASETKTVEKSTEKESSKSRDTSLKKKGPSKPKSRLFKGTLGKVVKKMKPKRVNSLSQTTQSIWDTRATVEKTEFTENPKFMPFNSEMSSKEFRLCSSVGATLSEELTKKRVSFIKLSDNDVTDADVITIAEALKDNALVKSIDLHNNGITGAGANALAELLMVNTTLHSVDLSSNQIGDKGASAFAKALKANKNRMTTIDLSSNKIGDTGAKALADSLKVNTTLTTMELNENKISDSGTARLAEALKVNTTMTSISLNGNKIFATGAKALADALKTNMTLTNMELNTNKIGAKGAKSLADGIKANKKLTILDLHNNVIGGAGAKALADALKFNTTMTTIDLSSNEIGDTGAISMAQMLTANAETAMTSIDLHQNKIGDPGFSAITDVLKTNKRKIINLDMSSNKIGCESATKLAEALLVNTTMTTLDLSYNLVGNASATQLAESLKVNFTLSKFDLHSNYIGNAGGMELAEALRENSALTSMSLNANLIGNEGAVAFSKTLRVNTVLSHLDLSSSEIGDIGAEALAASLKINTALNSINLHQNKIGNVGAKALADALKVNTAMVSVGLNENRIGDSGATALLEATDISPTMKNLMLPVPRSWRKK